MEKKSIIKSNHLNICSFQEYTKMDYLVFLFLLSKVNRFDDYGSLLSVNKPEPIKITAKEFAEVFSIDIDNSYKALKVAITSLQKKIIQFRDLFETDTQYTLITESSFYKSGYAEIHFNERIWYHIANLATNFTKYKLSSISKLETLPAIRLFELIIQFKKSGVMINTLDNIKFSLNKETISEYKIFKRDVLKPAIEELNDKHKKLNVALVEHRENRKVARLEFTFTPENSKELKQQPAETDNKDLLKDLLSD